MSLKVKKLCVDAIVPKKGSEFAAGYDLTSTEDIIIPPSNRALVSTGLSIEVPHGTYGRIAPRSGLAVRHGLGIGAGVIDRDYRGEVKVLVLNHNAYAPYTIRKGDRIAQLILECILCPDVVECDALDATERGEGGFGSTGIQ
jgi:dUTP pyrophosphatase